MNKGPKMSLTDQLKTISKQSIRNIHFHKPENSMLGVVANNVNITNAALLFSFEDYQFENTILSYDWVVNKNIVYINLLNTNDPILKDNIQLKLKTSATHIMDINLINNCKKHAKLIHSWVQNLYSIYARLIIFKEIRFKTLGLIEIVDIISNISEFFQNEKIKYYYDIIKQIKEENYNLNYPNVTESILIIINDTINIMFSNLEKTNIRFTRYISNEEITNLLQLESK